MPRNTNIRACLTFDVDLVSYAGKWKKTDEFESAIPSIVAVMDRFSEIKTTWFLRIDGQIEHLWKSPDHFLRKHAELIHFLRGQGHEIGWHVHPYVQSKNIWKQNTDERSILRELERYAPLAKLYGMESVRMGWGFHTDATMRFLSEQGFSLYQISTDGTPMLLETEDPPLNRSGYTNLLATRNI